MRHRRLPVTSVSRTLLDLAAVARLDVVRKAVAEADFRRLLDFGEIEAVLGCGRPGSAGLRAALERHRPQYARTLSALEDRFLDLCDTAGIPLPEVNVKVVRFTVDALWRKERVVVELDGHAAHGTHAALESDHGRDLALRAAGHMVVRYTWRQVTSEPARVTADLAATLAASGLHRPS